MKLEGKMAESFQEHQGLALRPLVFANIADA